MTFRTVKQALFGAFLLALTPGTLLAGDSTEDRILAAIDRNFPEQVGFLEKTVTVNSGTHNLAGVREVGRLFAGEFSKLGFANSWIDMPADMKRAGHLVSKIEGATGNRLLLIGHLDTVFPKDSRFQKVTRDQTHLYGPGILDMKGGNVVILYALKALRENGLLGDKTISVFLTGDEESVGMPIETSRKELIAEARQSDLALGFESGYQDQAVVARRGASLWFLEVGGKRAHSSSIFSPDSGAGAIFEASRILNGFYNALGKIDNLTFSPAVISGGTTISYDEETKSWTASGKNNVIAQTVKAQGDLRFISTPQLDMTREKMRDIANAHLPGTTSKIDFSDLYPAMSTTPENLCLLQRLDRVSRRLGYGPVASNKPGDRGASDVSFVAPHVTSIDALGPWGDGSHTVQERLDIDGLRKATKRAALLIYDLVSTRDAPADSAADSTATAAAGQCP